MIVRVRNTGATRPVGPDVTAAETVNSWRGPSSSSSALITTVPVLDVRPAVLGPVAIERRRPRSATGRSQSSAPCWCSARSRSPMRARWPSPTPSASRPRSSRRSALQSPSCCRRPPRSTPDPASTSLLAPLRRPVIVRVRDAGATKPVGPDVTAAETVNSFGGPVAVIVLRPGARRLTRRDRQHPCSCSARSR